MKGAKLPAWGCKRQPARLLVAAALLHSSAAFAAPAPGTRVPFQQQLTATDCSTSTIICKVVFPPVPVNRRREITFASCYFQASESGNLNFLSLAVEQKSLFISLIPVPLNQSGMRQYQSNDDFLLYLSPGDKATIAVGMTNNAGGAWVSGLSCFISGETIVTQ